MADFIMEIGENATRWETECGKPVVIVDFIARRRRRLPTITATAASAIKDKSRNIEAAEDQELEKERTTDHP